MWTCLPSVAPRQWLMSHMTSNSAAVFSHSSSVSLGNTSFFRTCHITVVVSNIIFEIAWFETLKRYDREVCESPDARYLKETRDNEKWYWFGQNSSMWKVGTKQLVYNKYLRVIESLSPGDIAFLQDSFFINGDTFSRSLSKACGVIRKKWKNMSSSSRSVGIRVAQAPNLSWSANTGRTNHLRFFFLPRDSSEWSFLRRIIKSVWRGNALFTREQPENVITNILLVSHYRIFRVTR